MLFEDITPGTRVRFYGTGSLAHKKSSVGVVVQGPMLGDERVLIDLPSGNRVEINARRVVLA